MKKLIALFVAMFAFAAVAPAFAEEGTAPAETKTEAPAKGKKKAKKGKKAKKAAETKAEGGEAAAPAPTEAK